MCLLAFVGQELGPYWAHLGPFGLILGHFRICVGLCFGLGHFSVVDFSPMQGVCKKHQKYQEKIQFVDYVADGFCIFLVVFVSFFRHAVVRLSLRVFEQSWAIFGSVSAFVLDSGMSASLTFRPCKACAKKNKNTRKKIQFVSPSGFPLLNAMT